MMTLSEYLRTNKMRQSDFADVIGMTQGAVSKMCRDAPILALETAVKIERITKGDVPIEIWPQFKILKTRFLNPCALNELYEQGSPIE